MAENLIGYARVSTLDHGQSVDPQEMRLREAGCKVIFTDTGQSGSKASRPGWDECLRFLQTGDTLCAVRLDRFGRSVTHLLALADDLNARGINLRCLDQPIDTTSAMGRMVFTILAAVAEFEREVTRERIKDGLRSTVANGTVLGAKRRLTDAQMNAMVRMREAKMSVPDIAAAMNISRASAYEYLRRARDAA